MTCTVYEGTEDRHGYHPGVEVSSWHYGRQGVLTSYLEEKGTLKASYPEAFWELTAVDGKNYVPGLYCIKSCGWVVNQELMEKCGFTMEDLAKDITELEGVLQTVTQREDNPDFATFVYHTRMYLENVPFYYVDRSLSVEYWIEETGETV